MKKMSKLFMVACFTFCAALHAQTVTLKQSMDFSPVKWRLNLAVGEFTLQNDTSKNQFIQVVLKKGSIGIYKPMAGGGVGCLDNLISSGVRKSSICELAPNETLHILKDMAEAHDATGTYQVQMG